MKHKLLIVLLIAFGVLAFLLTIGKARAFAPELALRDQPIQSIVTYFSNQNGVDPRFALSVMDCESHGEQKTVSDEGRSLGIFQIQKPTWERFTKEMGEVLDINSPFDQARVATFAFAHNHADEWTTAVAIKNGGSYSFYSKQLKRHFTVKCSLI